MNLFEKLIDLLNVIVGGFTSVWDALSTNVIELLETNGNSFTDFLLTLIEGLQFTDFFANLTLGGFIFGSSLLLLIVVFIIYAFIP